jgi:shikimate kinase
MNNIFLIGPMGAGKTAAGRALANKLGRPFTDTDLLVKKLSGLTPGDFIRKRGLRAWRAAERAAFKAAANSSGRVIALGGGLYPNRALAPLFKRGGTTVCLSCGEAELLRRLRPSLKARPLLGGSPEKAAAAITRLLKARGRFYRKADLTVDTTCVTPASVADAIAAFLRLRKR